MTNGRQFTAWQFDHPDSPQCLIDLDISTALQEWNLAGASTLSVTTTQALQSFFDLFRKETFASLQRLEAELALDEAEWQRQALPLGNGSDNDAVLVEALQSLILELQHHATPEILSLGYQFQSQGAKATIASLGPVDDGGTQALISAFYQQPQSGKLTKAEALQQAQIVLVFSKTKAAPIPSDRAVVQPETPNQPTRSDRLSPGYSHPYYWAPFILIPETPNQPTRSDRLSPGYSHPYYWAPFILIGNGL